MDEHQKQRHAELTGTMNQVCPRLVDVLRDMIRTRSFRGTQRDTLVAGLDALADVADELTQLDRLIVAEGKASFAAIKGRVQAEFEATQRAEAEAVAVARERTRAQLAASARRAF